MGMILGTLGGRGLRQGDPLSSLLFVLVMEYLSRLYHEASNSPGFKFHPQCKKNKLVHLMFTDDLLVFSAADPKTVQYIVKALENFQKV